MYVFYMLFYHRVVLLANNDDLPIEGRFVEALETYFRYYFLETVRHAVRGDIVVAWVDAVGNIAAVFAEDIEHIAGEDVWDRVVYAAAAAAAAAVVDQENIDNSWLQG